MKVQLWREMGITHERALDVVYRIDVELETTRGERFSLEVVEGSLNITADGQLLVVLPRANNRIQLYVEPG